MYLYDRVLALFSGTPYSSPTTNTIGDLSAHLTNTCLQTEGNEGCVRLLSELATHPVLSDEGRILTEQDTADILIQISQVLSDAFMAALQSPAYFQVGHGFVYLANPFHSRTSADAQCVRAVRRRLFDRASRNF